MTHEFRELPEWPGPSGNGCTNPRCGTPTGFLRVLSREEVEKVFPKKEHLSWWPLPPEATHVCTHCGYAYKHASPNFTEQHETMYRRLQHARLNGREGPVRIDDHPISDWDWDPDVQFEETVREAVKQFILGAPDYVDGPTLTAAVHRHVTGASASLAQEVLNEMDDDRLAFGASDFM